MDKRVIIRNFTKCADTYDRYADAQKIAALKLLEEIKEGSFKRILEIGCGTGNYTLLLREKFSNAEIKAVDISAGMLEVAANKLRNKKIEFSAADAETMELEGKFGLITSNACFQWFGDLPGALLRYKGLLNKNGVISFSVFGPLTFRELNASLNCIFEETPLAASSFMRKETIKKIVDKNFKAVKIKEVICEEYLPDLKSLLDKIKYSGLRGEGLNGKIFFTPRLLKRLQKVYLDKFKQIKATHQIFLCRAER